MNIKSQTKAFLAQFKLANNYQINIIRVLPVFFCVSISGHSVISSIFFDSSGSCCSCLSVFNNSIFVQLLAALSLLRFCLVDIRTCVRFCLFAVGRYSWSGADFKARSEIEMRGQEFGALGGGSVHLQSHGGKVDGLDVLTGYVESKYFVTKENPHLETERKLPQRAPVTKLSLDHGGFKLFKTNKIAI